MGRPSRIESLHNPLVDQLEGYLLSLGYQVKSAKSTAWQSSWFLWWLGDQAVEQVTIKQLAAYRLYLQTRPSLQDGNALSEKTIYGYERAVRLLFDYLLETGKLSYDPCSEWAVNYPERSGKRRALSQAEIKQLYAACETINERMILVLAYGCGLRASELELLNQGDVRLDEKRLLVRRGKNAKRRMVPLSEGVARALRRQKSTDKNGPFLLHSRGRRMRAYTANKRLKAMAVRAGLAPDISLHILRHSIATHLLENGMALDQVRLFLGHTQAATTEVYTHVETSYLRRLLA